MQNNFAKLFRKTTNIMNKKERLNSIIRFYSGGKPSVFAKFLGVAPSTISSWLTRDTFDYDLIFAKCENISPEWLLTGRGDMIKSDRTFPENHTSCPNPELGNTISKDNNNNTIPPAISNFSADTLIRLITDKDETIRSMAEEIGRLKERMSLLECRLQKDASSADTHHTANVG